MLGPTSLLQFMLYLEFLLGLDLCYLVFLDNFVQVLVVVQSNYFSDLFPSSCQQTN
jgi:hypothetical protein